MRTYPASSLLFLGGFLLWAVLLWPLPACADQTLHLLNPKGKYVEVPVSATRNMVYVATWCPTCKWWLKVVNDPQIKPYIKKRVTFVLEREWTIPKVAKRMKKGAIFYDASALDILPAPYYIFGPDSPDVGGGFVPAGFSPATGHFDKKMYDWLVEDVGIPQGLLDKRIEHYPDH